MTPGRSSLALAGCLALGGCSLTLEFEQCRDDDDCTNERNIDLVCGEDNTCIERPSPEDVFCDTTLDCARFFDDTHVCGPQRRCVSLISNECTDVWRPSGAAPDNTVFLGSILATTPPFDVDFVPIETAIRLAVEDYNIAGTLPSGQRVGHIACDSGGDPQRALAAARLLIDAGVPAIVGPSFTEEVLEVSKLTIPERTFLISPTATGKAITDLDDRGLVWRTISSNVYQASAIADRLADVGAERVVLLAKGDAYGNDLRTDLVETIDSSVALATVVYAPPTSFPSADDRFASYQRIVLDAFQHEADTVVVLGTAEAQELVLFYLDARDKAGVDEDGNLAPLPRFIVSHGGISVMESVVGAVSAEFAPVLMPAIEGISPVIQDADNFAAFDLKYSVASMGAPASPASALGYDAAMVSLLGMAAASQTNLDGVEVAKAMTRLVDPEAARIDFQGGQFIGQAQAAIVSGTNVDIHGVSGALDFDLFTGEVRTDLIGWGLEPAPGNPSVPELTAERRYTLDAAPSVVGTWDE